MDKDETDAPAKKEIPVISDNSLTVLAKELGPNSLRIAMYLNVPTVTLVNLQLKAQEKEQSDIDLAVNMIMQWKKQRELAKDKDKVLELERALRDCGKTEMADVISDKHRDGLELTVDALR